MKIKKLKGGRSKINFFIKPLYKKGRNNFEIRK